jgi:hypothetical protein
MYTYTYGHSQMPELQTQIIEFMPIRLNESIIYSSTAIVSKVQDIYY